MWLKIVEHVAVKFRQTGKSHFAVVPPRVIGIQKRVLGQ